NNPGVIPNLMEYTRDHTEIDVVPEQVVVKPTDDRLFEFPIVYVTGHGNIRFNKRERNYLRRYMLAGGFVYADDDYGMDESFRREVKKLFPDRRLRPIGKNHPLLTSYYQFESVPRIHEHDPEKPPRAFGIKHEGQWVLLYTYNTNISDGWASEEVHGDPPEKRRQALQFGVNILYWIFSQ
ncbi:MAG: DUF4159 domain-containing protein, partial [bacterium]